MEGSKVKGYFTRMVSEGSGNTKLVVNIEVSMDEDLRKKKVRMCSILEVR